MNHVKMLISALLSIYTVGTIEARQISDTHLCLGATGIVASTLLISLAAEHLIGPWLSGRNENQQRQKAYAEAELIGRKYENVPKLTSMSLKELNNWIQVLKKDKTLIENLVCTAPFKPNSPSKSSQPLEALNNMLTKNLKALETHYSSEYLNNICNLYKEELHLAETESLNQAKIKECVDEQYGGVQCRHHAYLHKLEHEITSCTGLFEILGKESISQEMRLRLNSLEKLLHLTTRLLTTELQQELDVKTRIEREKEVHEAELARMRKETEAYDKCKNVCNDLEKAVNTHNTMVAEVSQQVNSVKKAVKDLKEEVSQGRLWENLVRSIDQTGSENRIISKLNQLISPALARLREDIAIIKDRITGNRPQGFVPPIDPIINPPSINPEYNSTNPKPSAPPF